MEKELYLDTNGAIATIVINRPKKKNAFTLVMFHQLTYLLEQLSENEQIKLLIIRGVDTTAFSAGADISEFLDVRFARKQAKKYNDTALQAIELLYRFPKPTIAFIQSLAIGGGLELANACDFRFATPDSKLGITAANIGIVYNVTSTKRLHDLIGTTKTKELLYTAKLITAEEGKSIGLIDFVYNEAEIEQRCWDFAHQIISKSSVANTGIKQVIQAIIDGEKEESEAISNVILASFQSDDYKEGIQAFLEKRKPIFP